MQNNCKKLNGSPENSKKSTPVRFELTRFRMIKAEEKWGEGRRSQFEIKSRKFGDMPSIYLYETSDE
jgi:hypothetical protein